MLIGRAKRCDLLPLLAAALLLGSSGTASAGQDGDGVPDAADNCLAAANGPSLGPNDQLDADGDGFGNVCDGDFNQDGLVGGPDFDVFLQCFNRAVGPGGPADDPTCSETDLNGDGFVGGPDFGLFLGGFNAAPGPTGLTATPDLGASAPVAGASDVPHSAWIDLDFDDVVPLPALAGFALTCGGAARDVDVHRIAPERVVVNPAPDLPAAAACSLRWEGPDGEETLVFTTAADGPDASVLYDRDDAARTAPFPDDFWLVDDGSTRTGSRLEFPIPDRTNDVQNVLSALADAHGTLDGFSPLGPFVIELSDPADPATVPRTATEGLDPLATVGLFDLTPGPDYGARIPFKLDLRSVKRAGGSFQHALILHPSIPLTPEGRYGVVVLRRALTEAGEPIDPSPFFAAAIDLSQPGGSAAGLAVRALAGDVLDAIGGEGVLPIPREDVALAVRVSVRSTADIPNDLLSIREQLAALPPPSFTIDSIESSVFTHVEVVVRGTWESPNWRDGTDFARDPDGNPVPTETQSIPFILAIPPAALDAPVPITMYQHGNPGSAEGEVEGNGATHLGEAGFAVMGFTDRLNREIGQDSDAQTISIFGAILFGRSIPDFWMQTTADQLSFLRLIAALGDLDVLPAGAPDGEPDLDVGAPLTYIGISEGSNNGQAFLPYAPEIRAAAEVVGAARLGEVLFFQDTVGPGGVGTATLDVISGIVPNIQPVDLWVGFGLFQLAFDRQDRHNHAAFLYDNPFEVDGTLRKASILVSEGIGDSLVPNNATRSLAWTAGRLPHLMPVQQSVPFLDVVVPPLQGNIDAETTAAYVQYTPAGVPGIPVSLGCEGQEEGHFCAQTSPEARSQRVHFFQTAVSGVPEIIDERVP